MNTFSARKTAIVLLLAIVLSLGIIRTHSTGNVPYCINSAGCRFDQQPHGTVIYHTFGYPLAYRQTELFHPINSDATKSNYAGYAEASIEPQHFSLPSVILNVMFWFALLHLLSGFIRSKAKVGGGAISQNASSGASSQPVAKDKELS